MYHSYVYTIGYLILFIQLVHLLFKTKQPFIAGFSKKRSLIETQCGSTLGHCQKILSSKSMCLGAMVAASAMAFANAFSSGTLRHTYRISLTVHLHWFCIFLILRLCTLPLSFKNICKMGFVLIKCTDWRNIAGKQGYGLQKLSNRFTLSSMTRMTMNPQGPTLIQ